MTAHLSTRFRVGKKFTVEMTFSGAMIRSEWSPDIPRRLNQGELAEYRRGRDAFFSELAKARGISVMAIEPSARETRLQIFRDEDAAESRGRA
ncbi:hypothetical protein HUN39_18210 [Methylocystis sp. FS]|uniref:hypothetical protein n=1 Tax=Methylocystis silviterrae TaxID=2743612 RepID=UPI00158194EB|nr:hypothetical protein [Methylocystis silviterrae]NUJ81921.1 hypothetical protein [Methylocystis silviterrae]